MEQLNQQAESEVTKPVVHIITTGGTIASRIDPQTGAAVPAVAPAELLAQVPELARYAEVRLTDFSLVASWNITPPAVARLAGIINMLVAEPEVAGIVITHGTDTMEETAFALDLLLNTSPWC
jgi:L-asparaginase